MFKYIHRQIIKSLLKLTACDGAGDFVKMVVVRACVMEGMTTWWLSLRSNYRPDHQAFILSGFFFSFLLLLFFACVCIERIPGARGQVTAPGRPRESFFFFLAYEYVADREGAKRSHLTRGARLLFSNSYLQNECQNLCKIHCCSIDACGKNKDYQSKEMEEIIT